MPEINILPRHVAELIAAGEVVERPASVVKEIMENSIDAGADKITLEIRHGGTTYIRITDNGCGIDRANIKKAFISHATSKISVKEDLDAIYTLGFRGEALASIAAVSRVEILTAADGESIGTRYCIEGGEETVLDDAGCPKGTTLIIRDIFYNTPARMKFLKKDVTEGNAVAAVVDRIALSNPGISIRFIRDDKEVLFTSGDGNLHAAVQAVLGKQISQDMLPVEYELDGVRVSGFVSKPFSARQSRSMQFFFLNGRFVKTRTGMAALEEAYKNQIMVGKFPACVINISLNAGRVDVNVHPAKTEIRFDDERPVFNAVYYAVKSSLQQDTSRVPARIEKKNPLSYTKTKLDGEQLSVAGAGVTAGNPDTFRTGLPADPDRKTAVPDTGTGSLHAGKPAGAAAGPVNTAAPAEERPAEGKKAPSPVTAFRSGTVFTVENDETDLLGGFRKKSAENVSAAEKPAEKMNCGADENPETGNGSAVPEPEKTETAAAEYRVIGEAFKTYIIVEQGKKLLLIDKHAAHERMLFNALKQNRTEIERQILLVPETVTLGKDEYSAVTENTRLLSEAGFLIEDFGNGTVIVRECPGMLAGEDLSELVCEMSRALMANSRDVTPGRLDDIYHSMACRAAIKAGDNTGKEELEYFVGELMSHPEVRFCPHGRPVMIELDRRDLEKNFGRI